MAPRHPSDVTLNMLHQDLRAMHQDLKTTLVTGFRGLPTRESADEMVRLLRESNRLGEERFTRLDVQIREQHLETQQGQHALVEGQRALVEGQHALVEGQRALTNDVRGLSADIRALVARIDAIIRGRGDGGVA